MKQPDITTERLLLRKYQLQDANRVQELVGNFEVSKTTQNIPHPYTLKDASGWISSHAENLENGTRIAYAVTLKDSRELIGTVSLIKIVNGEASLGYWIGQPYWGKGYCSEAVSALLEFSKKELGLNRIYADHLTTNPASGRVMIKNGMKHVGQREITDRFSKVATVETHEILF